MGVIKQVTLCISNWYFKNVYWLCIKQREINWFINKIIYFFIYIKNKGLLHLSLYFIQNEFVFFLSFSIIDIIIQQY